MAKVLVGKFTFTVPVLSAEELAKGATQHADAGKEIEKPFEYRQLETEQEALTFLSENKKVSVLSLVNDKLKKDGRSNAYQAATLVYRPSEVPVEDIYERMRRDAIRTGMSEAAANVFIQNLKAASSAVAPETPATEEPADAE